MNKFFILFKTNKYQLLTFYSIILFLPYILFDSIFFDLLVWLLNFNNIEIYFSILFLIENYDILFYNNINFYTLLIAITLCLGIVLFLLLQANLLNVSFFPNSTFDAEKYSPYECGFTPFWTEWAQFDIKFYLVALLFLVFDVELMFLLPYSLSYNYLGFYSYIIFLIFFTILVVGFLVEWSVGMLVWKGEENLTINTSKNSLEKNKIMEQLQNYSLFVKTYLKTSDKEIFFLFLKKNIWTEKYVLFWKLNFKEPLILFKKINYKNYYFYNNNNLYDENKFVSETNDYIYSGKSNKKLIYPDDFFDTQFNENSEKTH